MATKTVLGSGPIQLFDGAIQHSIPLTALHFDGADLKADHWDEYQSGSQLAQLADAWLKYLVQKGMLVPGRSPDVALTIEAAEPGAFGNSITIVFANVKPNPTDVAQTAADVTVSCTTVYKKLTPADVPKVLGTAAGVGSHPGLVFATTSSPPTVLPTSNTGPTPLSGGKLALTSEITLNAASSGGGAASTQISVSDLSESDFSLTVSWAPPTAQSVKLADLNAHFGFAINVTTSPFRRAPAAGTITLAGGTDPADAVPGTKAQANFLSDP